MTRSAGFPLAAGLLATMALLVHRLAGAGEALQFDRAALAAGEWWRLLTCHWTHWSSEHLRWGLVLFLALAVACESEGRTRLLVALFAAAVAIPIAIHTWMPSMQTYRGLIGLASAAFIMLATDMLNEKLASHERRWVVAIVVLICGFFAKSVIEASTGVAVFADRASAGFAPVPLAHLVGGLVGAAAAILWRGRSARALAAARPAGPATLPGCRDSASLAR